MKKVHRGIKFNQKPCLKPYIDMNNKLRQQKKYLVSDQNCQTTKVFTENFLAIEMRKT